MKDDRLFLEHILDCIRRIEDYAKGDKSLFMESALVQDAVTRNLHCKLDSKERV